MTDLVLVKLTNLIHHNYSKGHSCFRNNPFPQSLTTLDLKVFSLLLRIVAGLQMTWFVRLLTNLKSGSEGRSHNYRIKQCCFEGLDFAEKANFHFAKGLATAKYFLLQ
jgi:hypothetical protein